MTKIKKQKGIIVDIHETLLDKKGNINNKLYSIVQALSKTFYICLVTSHFYNNEEELKKEIKELHIIADFFFHNHDEHNDDNVLVKENIYINKIRNKLNICIAIDNNKKVLKMYRQYGIDTLRYKGISLLPRSNHRP